MIFCLVFRIVMFFLSRFRRLITRPARFLLVNSVMLTTLICLFSFLSLAGYAAVYQALMPTVQLERSVHFKYAMRPCKQNEVCEHPVAKVVLPSEGLYPVLTAGTEYKIELALELPESDANMKMGMFMASIEMNAADGEMLRSAQRSTVLVYRSKMLRTLNTLLALPSLLLGQGKEKQLVRLIMFDRYVEPSSKFTHNAEVELHKADIQIYSAKLRILADFGGIRYLMYYWPLISAAVGITFNFTCLWILAALIWLRARLLPNLRTTNSINNSGPKKNNERTPTITTTTTSSSSSSTNNNNNTTTNNTKTSSSGGSSGGYTASQSELAESKRSFQVDEIDSAPLAVNRLAIQSKEQSKEQSNQSQRVSKTSMTTYARSKLAAIIDFGFSLSPIALPKFIVNVVLTVVSPEYSNKKHD